LQSIRRILQSSNPFHAHLNVIFFFRVGVTTASFLYAANRVIYCFLLESMLICIRLTGDYILLKRACSKRLVLKTFLLSLRAFCRRICTSADDV
jgi:hypothetical protein